MNFFQRVHRFFTEDPEERKKRYFHEMVNSILDRPKDYRPFNPYVIKGGKSESENKQ